MNQHPYRMDWARGKAARLGYFPAFGVLRFVVVLLLAAPFAWEARIENRSPSTLTCSTATDTDWTSPCLVHDVRTVGAFDRIPCAETHTAMESFFDAKNPLSRPFITASVVEGPPAPDMEVVPNHNLIIGNSPSAVFRRVKHDEGPPPTPFVHPKADVNGGIAADDARALLASCVANTGTEGPVRTVSFAIFERNFLPSAVVLAAGFVLALLFVFRRRASVAIDGSDRLEITERTCFVVRRRVALRLADVDRVVVGTGVTGPFVGSRVTLICKNGDEMPLTRSFTVLNQRVSAKMADRVRALVEARVS